MTWQYVPLPYATRCDALHLCLTAPTALEFIAVNPPPSTFPRMPQSTSSLHVQLPSPPPPPPPSTAESG